MPSNDRFELLCKKFEDSVNGDVNYPAFCQAIDEGNFLMIILTYKNLKNSFL